MENSPEKRGRRMCRNGFLASEEELARWSGISLQANRAAAAASLMFYGLRGNAASASTFKHEGGKRFCWRWNDDDGDHEDNCRCYRSEDPAAAARRRRCCTPLLHAAAAARCCTPLLQLHVRGMGGSQTEHLFLFPSFSSAEQFVMKISFCHH